MHAPNFLTPSRQYSSTTAPFGLPEIALVDMQDEDEYQIVYGEQPASQGPSQASCSQLLDASTLVVDPSKHHDTMPRHERRKRRQEWRSRMMQEQGSSPSHDSDNGSIHNRQDAFAALQALLESSTQPVDNRSPSSKKDCDTTPQRLSKLELALQASLNDSSPEVSPAAPKSPEEPIPMESLPPEPSPPDFPQPDHFESDDNHEDERSSSPEELVQETRKRKREVIRRKARTTQPVALSVDSFRIPFANKGRGREVSAPTSTQIVTTKQQNIVGTRPTHWNRSATKPTLRAHVHHTKGGTTKKEGLQGSSSRRSSLPSSTTGRKPVSSRKRQLNPRAMDFRPAFASKPPESDPLVVQDKAQDENRAPNSPRILPDLSKRMASPKTRKNAGYRKSIGGHWANRMATLRANLADDVQRLHHPSMYRPSFQALADPRKKAKIALDITILGGDASCGLFSSGLVVALCHIHRYVATRQGGSPSLCSSLDGSKAWVSFTSATAKRVGVQPSLQLRIYDAVAFQLQPSSRDKGFEGNYFVACTELCEQCPENLELANESSVVDSLP
eukprot:Nitzschia sp. Nitz4//scaffold55_size114948//96688//98442//NITZ4_003923-RA/size114948-augustus-gene-0.14-mRNA-1//1//CDS//3329554596//918//frame0